MEPLDSVSAEFLQPSSVIELPDAASKTYSTTMWHTFNHLKIVPQKNEKKYSWSPILIENNKKKNSNPWSRKKAVARKAIRISILFIKNLRIGEF